MNNVSPKLTISSNHKEFGYSERLILESIKTLCELNANFDEVINCKSINISFVSQQEIKELNRRFLNQNKTTNVLSFPSDPKFYEDLLGEIAICPFVIKEESIVQGKKEHDHLIHLIIHSVLHLLGYDHVDSKSAKVMEGIEINTLKKLGIANPY
tara:strand:+ start:6844 stop:7308 length:465 start_codon:yes stop_codon:yes gene_type:complete